MIFSSRILHQKETKNSNFQAEFKKNSKFFSKYVWEYKKKSKFAPSIDCKIV